MLYASNAVIENCLDAAFDLPIDQCCELTARDAYVSPVCNSGDCINGESSDAIPITSDHPDFPYHVALGSNILQKPHSLGDIEAHAPEINDVSARTKRRSVFHDGCFHAELV